MCGRSKDRLGLPEVKRSHTFLRWQQCFQAKICRWLSCEFAFAITLPRERAIEQASVENKCVSGSRRHCMVVGARHHASFGPTGDSCAATKRLLLDHLAGADEQRRRYIKAERYAGSSLRDQVRWRRYHVPTKDREFGAEAWHLPERILSTHRAKPRSPHGVKPGTTRAEQNECALPRAIRHESLVCGRSASGQI